MFPNHSHSVEEQPTFDTISQPSVLCQPLQTIGYLISLLICIEDSTTLQNLNW